MTLFEDMVRHKMKVELEQIACARVAVLEEEPTHRIEGCQHTKTRMIDWINNGACPVCLTATAGMQKDRNALLEKVTNLYSALFRGATPNTDMIIVTREAYDEINAALDALKEG